MVFNIRCPFSRGVPQFELRFSSLKIITIAHTSTTYRCHYTNSMRHMSWDAVRAIGVIRPLLRTDRYMVIESNVKLNHCQLDHFSETSLIMMVIIIGHPVSRGYVQHFGICFVIERSNGNIEYYLDFIHMKAVTSPTSSRTYFNPPSLVIVLYHCPLSYRLGIMGLWSRCQVLWVSPSTTTH